mmetsp:Transcript_17939/g.41840  ORF Transcript_17939/g.41840 Transcript_17939/m.41840 type:complete len:238 (-) Transcript_17939:82-795(-)
MKKRKQAVEEAAPDAEATADKKGAAAKGKKAKSTPKVGVLEGKVASLLPPDLKLEQLATGDDDDGPPEEISSKVKVAETAPIEEAPAAKPQADTQDKGGQSTANSTDRGNKSKGQPPNGQPPSKDGKKVQKKKKPAQPQYFWQEPENAEIVRELSNREQEKRTQRVALHRTVKDGFVIVRAGAAGLVGATAAPAVDGDNFIDSELYSRRKRKRSVRDRYDRNVLGRNSALTAAHITK